MVDQRKIANWLLNPDQSGDLDLEEAEVRIKEFGLDKVYQEIELPLINVLKRMKKIGVALDQNLIKKLLDDYKKKITLLEKRIYKEVGEDFNINSPQQLLKVFKEKYDLELKSTKAEVLEEKQKDYILADLILKYRELFKIVSTYLESFSKLGDRVYTTLIQTGAATGRLSSKDPNLQNVPSVVKGVLVADPGYKLVAFDYSQLELRILAAVTQDVEMIRAFKEGQDIHLLTASKVFGVPLDKVTKEMRGLAKTLNFGVVYGMGATAFSRSSGLALDKARGFIKDYFERFKAIKEWQTKIKEGARHKGMVTNLNGRLRWLPNINSTDGFLRAEAERAAINMPIQSLGADIIKLAMIAVDKKYGKSKSVKLVLSIHDELLFEIESDKLSKSVLEIKDLMENIYKLSEVKLEVIVDYGFRWSELK